MRIRNPVVIGVAALLVSFCGRTQAASDISSCGVAKGQVFSQSDTNVSADPVAYVFSAYATLNQLGSLTNAAVTWPGGSTSLDSGSTTWGYVSVLATQTNLDATFPTGSYSLQLSTRHDGVFTNLNVALGTSEFPAVPRLLNFAAVQAIDASQPFTLNWQPPTNGFSASFIQFRIQSPSGSDLFSTPSAGMAGALSGTNNSLTIPAGVLPAGSTNKGVLVFAHISSSTNPMPGMTLIGGTFRQTEFSLVTTGSRATNPPSFYYSSPWSGETGVPVDAPVTFTFDRSMALEQSIAWSTNVDATFFRYAWSADQRTLACVYGTNFPTNATISWTLSPTNGSGRFASVEGTSLSPAPISGSFTTGTNRLGGDVSAFIIYKGQAFVQDYNTSAVADTNLGPYRMGISIQGTYPGSILHAWWSTNSSLLSPLDGGRDGFGLEPSYTTASALDAAFPAGAYQFTLDSAHSGTVLLTNNLPASSYPSTPRISNIAAAADINVTTNFLLTWDAFATGNAGDFIQVQISDANQQRVFSSGDMPRAPGALNGTNTGVLIPAGVLLPGRIYFGELMFAKILNFDTNQYPGAMGISAFLKNTTFTIRTHGPAVIAEPDVSSFGIAKGSYFIQTNAGPPVADGTNSFSMTAFANQNHPGSIYFASVTPPNTTSFNLNNTGGSSWNREFRFADAATLDQAYSNGDYIVNLSLSHDGQKAIPPLVLDQTNFPGAPALDNFAAAQVINPNQPFQLTWTNLDATAADFVQFSIKDAQNRDIYRSPDPLALGALNGLAKTVTIPAGILVGGRTYTASLLLARAHFYVTPYFGTIALCGRFAQTRFSLQTTGTASVVGVNLIQSYPANQATNVPLNSTVTFEFNQPMAASYNVQWNGSFDPSYFSYHWTPDARKLICNYAGQFPANTTIFWTLGTGNFTGVSGAGLASPVSGSFTTGTNETYPDLSLSLRYKSESWIQHAEGILSLNTNEPPFQFGAANVSAQPFVILYGFLTPPGMPPQMMDISSDQAGLSAGFNTKTQLDTAFPNGVYLTDLSTAHHSVVHLTDNLTGENYPPPPQITNYAAAQRIRDDADFLLSWGLFTNGTDQDFVLVRLDERNGGTVLRTAEVPGAPGAFTGTNRSITIPAGTLQAGTTYRGSLMFAKIVSRDTNSFPGAIGISAYVRQTQFQVSTAPGLSQPQWFAPGQFRFLVRGQPNRSYTLLANTNLAGTNWFPIATTNLLTSPATLMDSSATNAQRFYRLRQD